jgi:hypothetical protein
MTQLAGCGNALEATQCCMPRTALTRYCDTASWSTRRRKEALTAHDKITRRPVAARRHCWATASGFLRLVRPSIWARRRSQHTECKSGDLGASSYRAYMHLVPLAPGSQPLPVSRLCRLSRWPDLAKSTRCGHRTSNDYNRDAGAERSGARRALQLLTIRAGAGVMTTREKNNAGRAGQNRVRL